MNFAKLCGSREIRLTNACQRPEAYRVTIVFTVALDLTRILSRSGDIDSQMISRSLSMYDYLSRQIFEHNIRRNYLYYKNSFLITRLIFSNLSMLFTITFHQSFVGQLQAVCSYLIPINRFVSLKASRAPIRFQLIPQGKGEVRCQFLAIMGYSLRYRERNCIRAQVCIVRRAYQA